MSRHDVIVVGGGIVGASIAYHLAAEAGRSVALLERGELTCGTTWHAAGLVAELRASANLTRLARYTAELYEQLEADGYPTGYKRVGAMTIAASGARQSELLRQAAMARNNGVDCIWLQPEAIQERWPDIALDGVYGAVYMPNDGQTNPVDTTRALAAAAKNFGAEIFQQTAVRSLVREGNRIVGVETDKQTFYADRVVLAAGLWTRTLAGTVGANVPVHAAEHFYAVSEPIDLRGDPVIVRDPDHGTYIKPDAGRLLVGCFERDAKPINADELPEDFAFDELPFDLDHFAPYLENAMHRVPKLSTTGIRTWFNGPEGFTPDGRYLLGPCAEVDGLYVACGFNSIGIQSAGGVGRVMARWLTDERPPLDLWEVDNRRFMPLHNQEAFLRSRTAESLGLLYAMHWPHRQPESARGQRLSPLHERMASEGACFGELNGWERPNWFAEPESNPQYAYAWGRQNWFENAAREHHAVRNSVAVFDQSSFAKYEVSGPDACRLLNRLCTAEMDVPIGKVVYCQWLNERGGIEADVTVTRIAEDVYWVVSACASERRDLHWLAEHSTGHDVDITNITDRYAVIGVMGPQAPALLQAVSDLDFGAMSFSTSRVADFGGNAVRAARITYVGAAGCELYMAASDAPKVYETLHARGVQHAGYHAMDGLRIEKGYRHWGHDITDEDTPIEAGLSFTVAWGKPSPFIGQAALEAQRERGVTKRLVSFKLSDAQAHLFHDEPIWRNGERVGHITSAAFGHTVGRCIGLGYVQGEWAARRAACLEGHYEIEIADQKIVAEPSFKPWFDPQGHAIHRDYQLG